MVVDGSRIPAPGPSRSRLARGSTVSRIPTRRDVSGNTTPRRVSRAGAEVQQSPTTPRRISNIPTPRRISKAPNDSNEPTIRRLSRTPAKVNPDRHDPPSLNRTPRRTALRMSHSNQTDPPTDAETTPTFRRSSIPTPRRASGANVESRFPNRITSIRPHSRLSSASAQDTPVRTRADRPETSQLPDRGTLGIVQPSPNSRRASNQRTSNQRTSMLASPYSRRTSGAGGARNSLLSPPGGRRVSNTANDGNSTQPSGPRRLSSSRPGSRRVSGSSRLLAPGERFQRPDRVESRRDSNVSMRSRNGGLSALESFRAVRRASIGSENQTSPPEKSNIETLSNDDTSLDDLLQDAKETLETTPTPATPPATPNASAETISMTDIEPLPDRMNAIANETPNSKEVNGRRTSTRFSDANVCLDNVERLRESLGRRRSHGIHDGKMPEAPQLRRSSLSKKCAEAALVDQQPGLEEIENTTAAWQRSPLRSIETNRNENSPELKQKRVSIVPQLDDDDLCLNEDVEDLGVW